MQSYSRREILGFGAAGAAAATAAAIAPQTARGESPAAPVAHERPQLPVVSRTIDTVCGVCFWKCGISVEVGEDGEPLHIRGNPNHPLSRGRLCPRGVGGIGMHQDPDRLRYPMIRTGERGEGVFRRASWEEAIEHIGGELGPLIERDGPGTLALLTHGSSEAHFDHLARALGTPHHTHPAYDQCKGPREVGFKLTFGHALKSPEPLDIENSECVVLIGSHLGENMHNLQVQELVTARARGARIVVVDPRRSTAAEKSDLWLQIRPGTDIALLLALIHVLIEEDRIDREFVRDHCEGFDQLRAHVQAATPAWAAAETGIPADDIVRAARMIGEAAPHVVIHPGRHVVWYGDDVQRTRAMAILVAITGSWGARGGYYLPHKAHLPSLHEAYPEMPAYPELGARRDPGYPFSAGINVNGIRQATISGRIKAWIVAGTNLITTLPARAETLQAIQRLEHLTVIDILPTEITRYADVLLPAASYLERPDPLVATQNRDPYIAIRQQTTEPIGESKCECWMSNRIGRALGLERFGCWNSMTDCQRGVIDAFNRLHPDQAVNWERLQEEGCVIVEEGLPIYRAGQGLGADRSGRAGRELRFPDFDGSPGTNKVKLFSPELDQLWRQKVAEGADPTGHEPLPTYYRPVPPPPGYVRLLYGRSPVHTFGRTQNTPVLAGREDENDVWVSPGVAEAYGLRQGELVEVVNQDGVREGPVRLRVTARMGEGSVYMTHGHGHNSRQLTRAYNRGADDSALMTRYNVDPLSGGTAMRVNFVRLVRTHAA